MIVPSIKFVFDRKHRVSNGEQGTIDLRVTYNYKQKFISTGVRCFPSEWDTRTESIKSIDSMESNAILIKIRKRALQIIGDMVDNDNIDLNAIPTLLKQKTADTTFIEYIHARMHARQVAEATKKSYRAFLSRFMDFGKIKNFGDITEKNIRDFDEYLHKVRWTEKDKYGKDIECQYTTASIEHLHKKLKVFINDAIIDRHITENPYLSKRIKIEKGGTRIDQYLTEEEVKKVEKAKMPTNSLAETRDLFLFQCYTGLSYSDLMDFDFTQVRLDGKYQVYTSRRQKTGIEFTFVLIPQALKILEKYGYKLPHLPNQKFNMRLKVIAEAAGIEKNLTTHVGRRTAGSIWLNNGIPIAVVSKCMGHSSIATTQKSYVKVLDKTIVQEFEKHFM